MKNESVCPWWLGYVLANPLRKLIQNPEQMLGKYVKPGMKVIDYGCGMGFFSLPMAKMIDGFGKVYCFDIQEKMLEHLSDRALNAGLGSRIEPRLVTSDNRNFKDLKQSIDFALLCAVAHEVPDREKLFLNLAAMLKPNGKLLFAEPKGHVSLQHFEQSISFAEKAGFIKAEPLQKTRGFSVLLEKISVN